MLTGQKTSVSGNISGLIDKAGAKIASAIQTASAKTGVEFSYLLQQAKIESSFRADAKSCSSSATGLYQFIDSTWLSMVNKYGDKYGLSDLADQISDNGKVSCNAVKKQILELRKDPTLASFMAAELAADNKDYLEKCTGQEIGSTDLYMAHFMGPAGASKFLNAMEKNPDRSAASLFPDAAAANKNIFYDKNGSAHSLKQVYTLFDQKFEIQNTETSCSAAASSPSTAPITETPDLSTENVLVALSPVAMPTIARPLYSNQSSLFTDHQPSMNTTSNKSSYSGSLFSMMSPIDVLEILRSQYTGHQTNS